MIYLFSLRAFNWS